MKKQIRILKFVKERGIEGGRMHKPLLDLNETEKARLYEQVKPYLE